MAASSEEVLLVVKRVRQKKQDSMLYLMAERIAWGPDGKDRFTVSHLYADIRSIAPRSTSPTRPAPSATTILPRTCYSKFKKKANKELEEKNRQTSGCRRSPS
ncbi:hypothetical protein AAFF_G00040890 [Aldrovandia affinis]|uniref:Uncharacterized protein n=1 Tax=Aldrovandia affinis TaxID=143900 RepID=A0AAD7S2W9_9TELE|nr:hypothetical protein AAFF_G00040890 [Aldrovandia affinis]